MTGYQIQMETKLKQLLDTSDSDTFLSKFIRLGLQTWFTVFVFSSLYGIICFFFLVLKIIQLTRERETLQKKIKYYTNSTDATRNTGCEF